MSIHALPVEERYPGAARPAPGSAALPRLLTTHDKGFHPAWTARTTMLPGWLDEYQRLRRDPAFDTHWNSLRWAIRLFRESRNFDAVVTGSERFALAFAAMQALFRRRRVPHVIMECMWNLPGGRLARTLKRWKMRLVLRGLSRTVAYTQRQVETYSAAYSAPSGAFVKAPYHSTLYGKEYPASDMGFVFSGGDSFRDYPTLIRAVAGLNYPVIIAALRRDHFRGLDMPGNVTIVSLTEPEFFRTMSQAALVVLPLRGGLLHAGGHQTFLNAMAMAKPVIVADDCGADEFIQNGVTGWIVAPGDPAALRQAIVAAMDDRATAQALGANARVASERFAPERFFEAVFALADEAAARSPRRTREA